MPKDKNDKEIVLVDYEAKEIVGVQIGALGHKLWICLDGVAILRVKAPQITLDDSRSNANDNCCECVSHLKCSGPTYIRQPCSKFKRE